jgi:hypothetical protein
MEASNSSWNNDEARLERRQAPAASATDGQFVLELPNPNGGVLEMRTEERVV